MYILRMERTHRYAAVVVLGILMGLASVAWSQPAANQGPQIQIDCRFVDFAPGVFPAKEIVTTNITQAWLAKAEQIEGKATVVWHPCIACPSNQWVTVTFPIDIPVVITEYDENGQRILSETEQMDEGDFLRVKPVLLEDGKVAMDIEIRFTTSVDTVTDPEGQIVPIMVTQVIRTSVIVPDRKRVTIRCGRLGELLWPSRAEAQAALEGEPRETLIIVTPKVIKRLPQAPGKPEATKETQKTD